MDPLSSFLMLVAIVCLVASWAQLIISASGEDYTWALCSVFLPPLAYFYGLFVWDKAGDAIKLAVIGLAAGALALA